MELQLVDVTMGLLAAFFVVAVIASTAVEVVSVALRKRSKDLDKMLLYLLDDSSRLKATSIYGAVASAAGRKQGGPSRRPPSYLSARSFADAAVEAAVATGTASKDATTLLSSLPPSPLKDRMQALHAETGGDLTRIKAGLESWFDDVMSRMQGAYKRWSQLALLVAGLVIAVALNVSATRIVEALWTEGAVRSAVIGLAPEIADEPCPPNETSCDPEDKVVSALTSLDELRLPIGWDRGWSAESGVAWTMLGWLPVSLAAAAGAPFWFDLLSRVAGIRGGRGVPLTAADDAASHTHTARAGMSSGTLDALIGTLNAARGATAVASDRSAPGSDHR